MFADLKLRHVLLRVARLDEFGRREHTHFEDNVRQLFLRHRLEPWVARGGLNGRVDDRLNEWVGGVGVADAASKLLFAVLDRVDGDEDAATFEKLLRRALRWLNVFAVCQVLFDGVSCEFD